MRSGSMCLLLLLFLFSRNPWFGFPCVSRLDFIPLGPAPSKYIACQGWLCRNAKIEATFRPSWGFLLLLLLLLLFVCLYFFLKLRACPRWVCRLAKCIPMAVKNELDYLCQDLSNELPSEKRAGLPVSRFAQWVTYSREYLTICFKRRAEQCPSPT